MGQPHTKKRLSFFYPLRHCKSPFDLLLLDIGISTWKSTDECVYMANLYY
jgi:hypothetical protein